MQKIQLNRKIPNKIVVNEKQAKQTLNDKNKQQK
jgi:hypothetical protein